MKGTSLGTGRLATRGAVRIVAAYAAGAALWVLLSEGVVHLFVTDPALVRTAHVAAGGLFVLLSATLLLLALRTTAAGRGPTVSGWLAAQPTPRGAERALPGALPAVVVLAAISVAILLGVLLVYRAARIEVRREALAHVEAVADLESAQVGQWFDDRLRDGAMFSRSSLLAGALTGWPPGGAPEGEERVRLAERLGAIREARSYRCAWILDAEGAVQVASGAPGDSFRLPEGTLGAQLRAGQPILSNATVPAGTGVAAVDVVVPLFSTREQERPSGFLVLRSDAGSLLFPLLERWPGARATAETVVVRRDGAEVVYLSGLRHRPGPRGTLRGPADADVASRALEGRGAGEGRDYRGSEVLAAWRPLGRSGWGLVAKIDTSEVNGPLRERGVLMALTTLLLLAAAATAVALWSRQQRTWHLLREKTAEVERKAVALHYGSLWQRARDVIVLVDGTNRIVDVNQRASELYGWSREELLGRPLAILQPAGSDTAFRRDSPHSPHSPHSGHSGVVEAVGLARFETVHARKDGTTFPVEITSSALEIDGQRFMQGIIRDVSERKAAERELRESEERFKETFERAAIGIAHSSPDGTLLRVNPKLCAILGRGEDDLLGTTFPGLTHADDLDAEREDRGRLLSGLADSYSAERRFLDGDGRVVWCNVSVAPVRGEGGEVRWLVHVVEDLSERRRSETALRDARAHAERLVAEANVMIVGFDLAGRVTLFNEAAERVTGFRREEVLGREVFESMLRAEAAARVSAGFDDLRRTGEIPRDFEFQVRTKGGRERWISWRNSVTSAGGVPTGVVSFGLDVTEGKQAEQRLKGLLRLAERSSELSEEGIVSEGLELAERMTGSQIAFCHLVDDEEATLRFLAWSRGTLETCTADPEGHFPLERAGVWADCVRTRRSVVCNDFEAYPGRKGVPEGHPALRRLVSSPVLDRGKVRMVLGVGNKDADYDELDVRQVELIAAEVWRVAQARRSEESARHVDARFRTLVEGQKALFLEGTLEPPLFTWVGGQLREMLGYEPADWLADPSGWVRAIHPDDREQVAGARARLGAEGRDHELDYRMVASDGRVVWIHDAVRIVKDASGVPARTFGLLVDVTEIHRKEELVRDLAAKADRQLRTLETILSATPDLVHLFDVEGRVLYVSASALDLYGKSAVEVSGRTWSGIGAAPEGPAGAGAGVPEVVRTGRPFAGIFHVATSGGPRDVSYQLTPVFGPDGTVDAVVSTGRDVTDEQAAHRRIERLNRLYGAVSGLNRAIARSTSAEDLLKEVCRVLVASGNFVAAWVAWASADGLSAPIVGVDGPAANVSGRVPISLDASRPEGRGPTSVAIREGRLVVMSDDPATGGPEGWEEVARRAGIVSGAAVPVFRGGKAGGALAVFAAEKGTFDVEMSGLLEEIARDVSHALDAHDERERRRSAEEELREAARRLTEAEKVGGTGSWWLDYATNLVSYSEGANLIFGTGAQAPVPVFEEAPKRLHPDDLEAFAAAMKGVRRTGEPAELEHRVLRQGGEVRWVRVRAELRRDAEGKPVGSFGTMTDITDRKRDEEQRLLWANLLEASREAVVITNSDGRIVRVNRAFEEITGFAAAEAVGQNPRILQSGRHDRDFYAEMWAELLAAGRWRGEIWNRRKNGEVYPAFLSLSAVKDAAGVSRFVGISSDISEQKSAAERVQFLSHHDALTGLPNRSLFDAILEQALAAARRERRRMAVLCLDVDLFKTFNESFGHVEGDRLLRDLAGRLSGCLRGGDALSRPGGDEFLVLIPNVADAGDLGRIAQKLLDVASQPFEAHSRRVTLTTSLGIAVHPGDADDGQGLLRAAEAAMYHAKESGRNNYQFFAREMNRRTVEALEMETRLLRAVVGDELFLEFQPQIEIETGRVIGVEALVRWRDPERGVIGPATFIPMAEERGLVAPIGEWVLRRACEETVRWQRQGKGTLPVSVNISALQFRQPAFEERLSRILEETRIDPGLLELELTESILMKDAEQMIGLLQRLRGRGLRFAIDDFGTGWSSLAYLRRFPIDRLKIDQSFVRDLGHDPGADSIVQAVISLARNLRLRAVAEGVETRKQLAFLRFHGCDEAQGFLLCRPVAPDVMWGRIDGGRIEPPPRPPEPSSGVIRAQG